MPTEAAAQAGDDGFNQAREGDAVHVDRSVLTASPLMDHVWIEATLMSDTPNGVGQWWVATLGGSTLWVRESKIKMAGDRPAKVSSSR